MSIEQQAEQFQIDNANNIKGWESEYNLQTEEKIITYILSNQERITFSYVKPFKSGKE